MADHFYGASMGDRLSVSTGTSTTSKKVELRVEDGVSGNNKMQVLLALKAIEAYIQTHDAPA